VPPERPAGDRTDVLDVEMREELQHSIASGGVTLVVAKLKSPVAGRFDITGPS
jgi:hypothetical protein